LPTSSELAVVATNLGKRYRLGESIRHDTARDWISGVPGRLVRRKMAGRRAIRPELWALREVDFEIERGDVVGVVGRNGAGKSTLLKILTRVTRPTTGSLRGWGRVGSLLEIGTGFHPELTGRENVYLSGAVLGMRRAEIARKFDRIVEFSGIEHMLDTPVKRYSSGMYVRLGFSVAAHLEPDILAIDEVLSVGDAVFQGRSLELVRRLAEDGTTVLLVSHNLGTVTAFCRSGLLLEEGRLTAHGPIGDVVRAYGHSLEAATGRTIVERTDRSGTGRTRLTSIRIDAPGRPAGEIATGEPLTFTFEVSRRARELDCAFSIYDASGNLVADFASSEPSPLDVPFDSEPDSEPGVIVCEFDELLLMPGRYRVDIRLYLLGDLADQVDGAAFFTVGPGAVRGRPVRGEEVYGAVQIPHVWRFGEVAARRSGARLP